MDVVKRISDISEEEVDRQIKTLAQLLISGQRGREFLGTLRKLIQFVFIRPNDLDGTPFIDSLMRVLKDEDHAHKIKFLSMAILNELLEEELPSLATTNLNSLTKSQLLYVLPLVLVSTTSFTINLDNMVDWFIDSQVNLRHLTFPALIIALKKDPPVLLFNRHIQPIEMQMSNWLFNASRVSAQATQAVSFLKMNNKPQPVTELDGSPSQDFYTLLNLTQLFTDDQIFNIQTFSMLYFWIHGVYIKKKGILNSGEEECDMNPIFQKNVTAYCLRVIEQSKLIPTAEIAKEYSKTKEICVIEAIRILDLLCLLNTNLLNQIFPTLIKISMVTISQLNDRNSGLLYLVILQFFLNHSEAMSFDPDSLFRTFLEFYVGSNYSDPIASFEILHFFRKNKKKIISTTNFFSVYFPPLLKLFAWNPEYFREIKNLLPSFVGPATFLELFHTLLDLPLITAALSRIHQELPKIDQDNLLVRSGPLPPVSGIPRSGSLPIIQPPTPGDSGRYRVLYNHFLRNESGVSVNWWNSTTTREILDSFCKEMVVTLRIRKVAEHVPELLEIFFNVLIGYSDEKTVTQIVPEMFQRMDQLVPLEDFQLKVQNVMVQQLLAIFERYPSFIVKLKDTILGAMNNHSKERRFQVLHLCWIIGEYASPSITSLCTPTVISDYDEALELMAFERMSLASLDEQEGSLHTDTNYNNMLMSVLISSLSKLAARYTPLVSRVSLCLIKMERYRTCFHPAVISRMEECINILRYPSVASAVLDTRHKISFRNHHVDKDSSLPFLLQSTEDFVVGRKKLHPFENI